MTSHWKTNIYPLSMVVYSRANSSMLESSRPPARQGVAGIKGDQMRRGEDDGQHRKQQQNPVRNIPDLARNVGLAIHIDRKSADDEGGGNANPCNIKFGHASITVNTPDQPAFPMVNTEI
jgi:hypothetical protein